MAGSGAGYVILYGVNPFQRSQKVNYYDRIYSFAVFSLFSGDARPDACSDLRDEADGDATTGRG